ncbi:MAG: NAD(P)/FAD-dependent oxidoreductase [Flavipsychrobacter sp.]
MDIAIIGGGAAGCFAAANISVNSGDTVTLYEKTGKLLQKVKVSGGGRCNVTHACFDVPELITKYPRGKQFLKKSLYQFPPQNTIKWFEERGVVLKTEEDGRMFPTTDSSQTIIDCLTKALFKNKVHIAYHKAIKKIEPLDVGFKLHFADGSTSRADKVLIACGGFPKVEQYNWIKELGHTIENPVPSLFTFNMPKHPITKLMGVAVPEVTLKIKGSKSAQLGPLLITHWGMSGPVVLRTSAWAAKELSEKDYDFNILINWLDNVTEEELKAQFVDMRQVQGKQLVKGKNPFQLPKRLWEYFTTEAGVADNTKWGDLSAASQNKLLNMLIRDEYHIKGKTTFKEEFVTCGGIKLSEVDAQTMESKKTKGLYFAGELLNVDGITGGFNFQHAWSSGYIAAQNMML